MSRQIASLPILYDHSDPRRRRVAERVRTLQGWREFFPLRFRNGARA